MVTQKSDCTPIKGASTGIGAIYADRPARRGFDPVLITRNRNRMDALAERLVAETGPSVEVVAADQSATYRGIDFWKIVIWAGLLLAGAIFMVDPVELLSYSAAPPVCFLAPDYVGPSSFVEKEVRGATADPDASAKNEDAARLFGMDTEQVTDGALLAVSDDALGMVGKWSETPPPSAA